jgi:hypothetical protein
MDRLRALARSRRAAVLDMAVSSCVIVWAAQYGWHPTLLVGTGNGLQTVLQALPSTFVAMFALGFGALFVVVQQAASTISVRAALLLLHDERVIGLGAITLLLTAASLLIGGQVPAGDAAPGPAVSAAVGTLMIAAVVLIAAYVALIPGVVRTHTSPEKVVPLLRAEIARALAGEKLFGHHLASLGELGRQASDRWDKSTYDQVLTALIDLAQAVDVPESLVVECALQLIDAAEAAQAEDAPSFASERLLAVLPDAVRGCLDVDRPQPARRLLDAYAHLGTRRSPPERAADLGQTAGTLATFVADPSAKRSAAVVRALALWGVTVAVAAHVGDDRADVEGTRPRLGRSPPYKDAREEVDQLNFRLAWPGADRDAVRAALREPGRRRAKP